ncbi:hypothetical protein LQZ18_00565 [Lachnospiraceae bacterium ZAX-1]
MNEQQFMKKMINRNEQRRFSVNIIPKDILMKMNKAKQDAESLDCRHLKCPHCGYIVAEAYADTGGHVKVKCQKCKEMTVYNLTPGTPLSFRISND